MTPYDIGVLLHYHCTMHDHPDLERNPPIWRPSIQWFLEERLLESTVGGADDAAYRITERGRFYVDNGLCEVPLPVQEWRIPERPRPIDSIVFRSIDEV